MSSINTKALPKISYGLFIITSRKGGRFNGQVANTVFQVSSEPVTIGISINRNNLTNEFIKDSKLFAVSILARDTPLALIGRFGFNSGRQVDKFEKLDYQLGSTGLPYITDHSVAYLEAEVVQEIAAGTHDLFIGRLTGAEILKEGAPMTYADYHTIKTGGIPKTDVPIIKEVKTMKRWRCKVCGYVHEGELPPERCPVCKAP
ncbi:MAG: flavin reductase, partial [Heliobacteriaceae bacterium]|nr:flavin reductase [Heliobacteriaceae bacterium]